MGKTLIVYATKHGCTEKCAGKLEAALSGEVTTLNVKEAGKIDLADYGSVAVGGSIYAGRVQRSVRDFCARNLKVLQGKRLGLFLCHMEEGEKADEQFVAAFPKELVVVATAKGLFGGEFDFDRMNWLEKAMVKKIAKITVSVSKIDEGSITAFARALDGPAV